MASFDAALELQPDNDDALGNRSNTLNALGRFTEAQEAQDRAFAVRAARIGEGDGSGAISAL